jgi:hypothetical protein
MEQAHELTLGVAVKLCVVGIRFHEGKYAHSPRHVKA